MSDRMWDRMSERIYNLPHIHPEDICQKLCQKLCQNNVSGCGSLEGKQCFLRVNGFFADAKQPRHLVRVLSAIIIIINTTIWGKGAIWCRQFYVDTQRFCVMSRRFRCFQPQNFTPWFHASNVYWSRTTDDTVTSSQIVPYLISIPLLLSKIIRSIQ